MKLAATLLIWVGIVFMAAPVWADRVPCCEFTRGSLAGFSAGAANGFEMNSAIHGRSSELFRRDNDVFSIFSSREVKSGDDLKDLASYERFSSHTKPGKRLFDGRGKDRNSQGDDPSPTSVPEPGTLSLLLLGVSAVGIFARTRRC